MKIPRWHLVCATDKMLKCIGVMRKNNSGWLTKAMRTEFSNGAIDQFYWLMDERAMKRVKKALRPAKAQCAPIPVDDEKARAFAERMYREHPEWFN